MNQKLRTGLLAIALSILGIQFVGAQSPGGVSPAAWYKADASATVFSDAGSTTAADNATVQQWNSLVGNYPLSQTAASSRPVYSSSTQLANFNPTLYFDGSNDWLRFTAPANVNIIDRARGTIYAAGFMDRQKRSGFAGFHNTIDYPGLHVFSNHHLLFFTGGPGYQGLSSETFQAQRFFTAGTGWENGTGASPSYASANVSLNGLRLAYNGNQLNNANADANARDFRIGSDSNYGAFSGQLNEILVFEEKLSEAEMDQVESYLALKYGSTFANGTRDYKNASGGTVWSLTANTGFTANIAGIARDDNGALYQKQSWSTNPEQQVLIGLGPLAGTNAANGGTLSDGQYLIWGDNNAAKTPTVSISSIPGISHHFAAIWKVQNTGNVGTVRVAWPKSYNRLTLIQSTDASIDASDTATDMSGNEITINGVTYQYADVTLANGTHFTFGAKLAGPGGVTNGLTQWYRADAGVVSAGGDGTSIVTWTDFVKGTVSEKISTAPVPLYQEGSSHYFNFNPGINFTDRTQMLGNINTQTLENTAFDIFTLTKEKMTGGRFFNIGMNNTRMWGDNWDQPGLNANGTIGTRNSSGGAGGTANPGNIAFNPIIPSIMYNTFTNTTIRKGVNGNPLGTAWNVWPRGQMTGGHIFGSNAGPNPPRGDDWGFVGNIGEVIIFGGGNVTPEERNRVDSYLALKYGITLPAGVNYLDAQGNIVWNATDNSDYHHHVAGIASDEAGALHQRQSISVNPGAHVLIGTTGLVDNTNTNAANSTSLSDGQYLVWGDNGGAKSLSVGFNYPAVSNLNLRFGATWKVQNSNSVGIVRIAWPAGIPNLHLIRSSDAVFDDSDPRTDMTGNSITVNGITYNYADVTLADGQYFTFAGYVVGPGGVPSAAWYRADATGQLFSDAGTTAAGDGEQIQQWNEYKGSGFNLLQATAGQRPVFSGTRMANFNPTVTFDGTNDRMAHNPASGDAIIDRTQGALFAAGNMTKANNGAMLGFGSPTGTNLMDDPGLYAYTGKLLFYPQIGYYNPQSTNNVAGTFIGGTTWENGAGTGTAGNTNYTYMTLTGYHEEFNSGIRNVTNTGNTSRGFVIGADDWQGFGGQLNELVVFGHRLSYIEVSRVESYLAIKYGQTLSKEQNRDYVNSSGTPVWNATANEAYHHNVAGIARDDEGSLYQKQSWSANSGTQVLISTTGLANTNATNSSVLGNGQYLLWGDNGLSKSASVPFATIGGLPYLRFPAAWKVQNTNNVGVVRVTWQKGLANLKLIVSNDETFTTADDVYEMNATQTVNGVEYAYTDVTLADGQYFTFAAFLQAPGGVFGQNVWLRANDGTNTTADGEEVSTWINYGGAGGTAEPLDAANNLSNGTPDFQVNAHNFNPAILDNTHTTTVDGLLLRDVFEDDTHRDLSTFVLQSQPNASQTRTMVSFGNNTVSGSSNDLPWFANNNILSFNHFWQGNGDGRSPNHPNSLRRYDNVPSINSFYMPKWETGGNPYVSSNSLNGATSTLANRNVNASIGIGNHLFVHGDGGSNNISGGSISEVIAYDKLLTPVEKLKVNSYLAIKYGITLHSEDGTTTPNYLNSNENIIWNATDNSGYNNHIAGIGYDFISTLHQKQSSSVNATTSQVTIALGEIAETNASNPNNLSDGQFLLWGDNGNTQAMSNSASNYTGFTYAGASTNGRRMNRVWKVQNTGVNSQVAIRFSKASMGTTTFPVADECADYVMIYAEDENFTTGVSVLPLVENEEGTDYETSYTFPNGASYFTFGKVTPLTDGTVVLAEVTETTNEYDATCNTGEWTYFQKSGQAEEKLFAAAGFSSGELDAFEITITPEGTTYDEGSRVTKLMPRITTIADNEASYSGTNKIRVYYSADELAATIVPSASVSSWLIYTGDADDVLTDVFPDGVLDHAKAQLVTPDASGTEDGIPYVEFHGIEALNISIAYISTTESDPLPVSLIRFRAEKEAHTGTLLWSTTSELHNTGFEVERSGDARNWVPLGFVTGKSEAGNSDSTLDYSFTDASPLNGRNYYRLKQIDFDGTFEYSHVVVLNFRQEHGLTLYPNPARGSLQLNSLNLEIREVKVFNMAGVQIKVPAVLENRLNVEALPAGRYILRITTKDGETISRNFVVQ